MKPARTLIASLGTSTSMLAAAACLVVLASTLVAFNGWPVNSLAGSFGSIVVDDSTPLAVDPAGKVIATGADPARVSARPGVAPAARVSRRADGPTGGSGAGAAGRGSARTQPGTVLQVSVPRVPRTSPGPKASAPPAGASPSPSSGPVSVPSAVSSSPAGHAIAATGTAAGGAVNKTTTTAAGVVSGAGKTVTSAVPPVAIPVGKAVTTVTQPVTDVGGALGNTVTGVGTTLGGK